MNKINAHASKHSNGLGAYLLIVTKKLRIKPVSQVVISALFLYMYLHELMTVVSVLEVSFVVLCVNLFFVFKILRVYLCVDAVMGKMKLTILSFFCEEITI